MSSLAKALKDEITRLARKEAKAATTVLQKASAQYRRDIAELKRQNAALLKKIAFLEKQEKRRVNSDAPAEVAQNIRFSARSVAAHRKKLALSAADYGQLVGVSLLTIYNWENGKSKPRQQQLASWAQIRGLGKREAWERLDLLEG